MPTYRVPLIRRIVQHGEIEIEAQTPAEAEIRAQDEVTYNPNAGNWDAPHTTATEVQSANLLYDDA